MDEAETSIQPQPISTAKRGNKPSGVLALYARKGKYEARWTGFPAVAPLDLEVEDRPVDVLAVYNG